MGSITTCVKEGMNVTVHLDSRPIYTGGYKFWTVFGQKCFGPEP